MSLLLNALKKAEEGGQPSAQSGDKPVSPSLASGGGLGGGKASSAPQVVSRAASASVDFDAIVDDKEVRSSPPGGRGDGERKSRVNAARVFGAGSDNVSDSGGIFGKLVVAFLAVMVIGGGGYFVLETEVIPGVNSRSVLDLFGQAPVRVVQPQVESGVNLEVSEDIILLPIPAVDVQSEVNFAALRLPENNRSSIGEDAYVRQIAFLTGFDINQEKARKVEEQRELLVDLEVSEELESAEEDIVVDVDVAEDSDGTELAIYTADASREVKMRLESRTASDDELNIKINGGVSSPDENSTVVPDNKVAQLDVRFSNEGRERRSMINRARDLYNNGEFLEADAVYRNVLVSTPSSREALRGIAQVAVASGRYQSAIAAYLDLLGYYPNDPIAIAELTNLRGSGGNFYEIEDALKKALGKMPSADGRLYFSLGNLYAGQRNYTDAQEAYFEAFSRETQNPDYAYNLAVILDFLNKRGIAVRYYQEALRLSANTPVGFNRQEVESRINDLR